MIAYSAIRAKIRELEAKARMTFLAPISKHAVLEAKRGTLEQEYAAVSKMFDDAQRRVREQDAAEMARLRHKLRSGRRRPPQRLLK
jgi:hypothetical protein